MHLAREEALGAQVSAAGFGMGETCPLVAGLGVFQVGTNALQINGAGVGIKPQRRDQGVGGVADLAQCDQRIFPPAVARSGAPRKDDSPS